MNSSFTDAEQPEICLKFTKTSKHKNNMESPDHNTDLILDKDIYTVKWDDIENTEIDYDNYLNEIESFFREDFENDILEQEDV